MQLLPSNVPGAGLTDRRDVDRFSSVARRFLRCAADSADQATASTEKLTLSARHSLTPPASAYAPKRNTVPGVDILRPVQIGAMQHGQDRDHGFRANLQGDWLDRCHARDADSANRSGIT